MRAMGNDRLLAALDRLTDQPADEPGVAPYR
jgi:hypothetical protein